MPMQASPAPNTNVRLTPDSLNPVHILVGEVEIIAERTDQYLDIVTVFDEAVA